MFRVDSDLSIHINRGDIGCLQISAENDSGGSYTFVRGDIVRLNVMAKGDCSRILLSKTVLVDTETESVEVTLESEDTRLCEVINKPVSYWYEIELNPETQPQTLIGYDKSGPKLLTIYPEGGEEDDR